MLYSVIIVDDENIICDKLKTLVSWENIGFYVVETFSDGKYAIEYLNTHHADVILTDIKMTFVSGLELAKFVQDNQPDTAVIFLSGHQEFDYALQGMKYGVDSYLVKPVDIQEIESTLTDLKFKLDNRKNINESINYEYYINTGYFIGIAQFGLKEENIPPFLDINIKNAYFNLFDVTINNFEQYFDKTSKYGKEKFINALNTIFKFVQDGLNICYLNNHENSFVFIAFANNPISGSWINEAYKNFNNIGLSNNCSIKILSSFQGIEKFKKAYATFCSDTSNNCNLIETNIEKHENRTIKNTKAFIADNFDKEITLEEVANAIFVSPPYLSKLFKEQTGENFSDYIIKIKMEKTKVLLNSSSLKIYEISNLIGYKSMTHFHKLFKKYTGISPNEYRNRGDTE